MDSAKFEINKKQINEKINQGKEFEIDDPIDEKDYPCENSNCDRIIKVYITEKSDDGLDKQIARGKAEIVPTISIKTGVVTDRMYFCSKNCSDEGIDTPLLSKPGI